MMRHLSIVVALLLGLVSAPDAGAQNTCASGASAVNPLLAGASTGTGGIGGTGAVAGRPGLGGTGISEGGIGGTGIVGVITGFASICVNGVEVQFDDQTPVTDAGEPVSARQLAVGQLVALRAGGSGAMLSASRIALIHTAVGPLTAVDAATGEFRLLGQTARALEPAVLGQLLVGDWVRVSGQRLARGEIAASRVERIAPQALAQLNGVVERVDAAGFVVGGARIALDTLALAAQVVAGREVTVSGQWNGRALLAQRVVQEPTRSGLGPVAQVIVEAYLHQVDARQIDLGLGAWPLGAAARLPDGGIAALAVNQRVQVTGRVGADQQITVERVDISASRGDAAGGSAASAGRGSRGSQERERPRGTPGALDRSGSSGNSSGSDRSGESERSGSSERSGGSEGGSGGGGKGK